MIVYVVSKITDSLNDPSTEVVSVHVNKGRADAAAKAIAGRIIVQDTLQSVTYGVVESVELDLIGLMGGDAQDCAEAAGFLGLY